MSKNILHFVLSICDVLPSCDIVSVVFLCKKYIFKNIFLCKKFLEKNFFRENLNLIKFIYV